MPTWNRVLAYYALNALWQAPLVVAASALVVRLLRGVRAAVVHRIWIACLLLAVALPALSLLSGPVHVPGIILKTAQAGIAPTATAPPAITPAAEQVQPAPTTGKTTYRALPFAWAGLLLQAVGWIYLGALGWGILRLLWGIWLARRLVRTSTSANLSSHLSASLERCLQAYGMTNIDVRSSTRAAGPATVSWPRPLIVLPKQLEAEDAAPMEAAFCHELAHVRRKDFLLNLAYNVCGLPLSFHPAMHWVLHRLQETREMACDEMAAQAMHGPCNYARNLLKLAEGMCPAVSEAGFALGIFDDEILERRVMNLIQRKAPQTLARTLTSTTMAVVLFAVILTLGTSFGLRPALAQSSPKTDHAPTGWFLAGDRPANYKTGLDPAVMHASLPSAYLASRVQDTGGFGTLMQSISAKKYAGKRVRLRGWVKTSDVGQWAGLWMRIDKGSAMVDLDNMQNRPIKGTNGWTQYDVVLSVPSDATGISFGVLLHGPGEVWINDLKFDVVPETVATTSIDKSAPDAPVNLAFQR